MMLAASKTSAKPADFSIREDEASQLNSVQPLSKVEVLRLKINNEDYIHEAIQRIALVISNELLDLPRGGKQYERQRKTRQWPRK